MSHAAILEVYCHWQQYCHVISFSKKVNQFFDKWVTKGMQYYYWQSWRRYYFNVYEPSINFIIYPHTYRLRNSNLQKQNHEQHLFTGFLKCIPRFWTSSRLGWPNTLIIPFPEPRTNPNVPCPSIFFDTLFRKSFHLLKWIEPINTKFLKCYKNTHIKITWPYRPQLL